MKPKKQTKYQLTINVEQAEAILRACEFYFRVGMGQLEEIRNVAIEKKGHKINNDDVDTIIKYLKLHILGWEHVGTSHSILSKDMPDEYRVACDIHDVIRERLIIDDLNPGHRPMGAIFHDVRQRSKQPLPVFVKIDEKVKE